LPIKAEKSSEGINPGAERMSGSCQSNPLTPSIPLLENVESSVHPQTATASREVDMTQSGNSM